jgi:hypothetical protein
MSSLENIGILYITISKYALLWFQHITEIRCTENEV